MVAVGLTLSIVLIVLGFIFLLTVLWTEKGYWLIPSVASFICGFIIMVISFETLAQNKREIYEEKHPEICIENDLCVGIDFETESERERVFRCVLPAKNNIDERNLVCKEVEE